MKPYYEHGPVQVFHGDCREVLPALAADSIDAIVTDPPYGLTQNKKGGSGPASVNLQTPHGRARVTTGFMGMQWDGVVPGVEFWQAALRVAKPGAHLLAFGGTRTFHRLTCAIEDAGWEVRDCVMWVYGSGFPKSLDVSKAIDKAAGAEREVVGSKRTNVGMQGGNFANKSANGDVDVTIPATAAAAAWAGWGTALKPAWEPIIVARKPIPGTVAANVLEYGTGAMNIDASRIELTGSNDPRLGGNGTWGTDKAAQNVYEGGYAGDRVGSSPLGRWPANVMHDGSSDVVAAFPQSNGQQGAVGPQHGERPTVNAYGDYGPRPDFAPRGDAGSAARFFYCAKASRSDRSKTNSHATVKPTALMRYLCRLVTPDDGIVLDMFMGSGSTGKAARKEGFRFIGIEQQESYCKIAAKRLSQERRLF